MTDRRSASAPDEWLFSCPHTPGATWSTCRTNRPVSTAGQPLKLAFMCVRGLGASLRTNKHLGRLVVNSDVVSMSVVSDARYKSAPPQQQQQPPLKLDLAAPVELVFKHLDASQRAEWPAQRRPLGPVCVFWDTATR